jgi:hypothetical protein
MTRNILLVDPAGTIVAEARVERNADGYSGSVDLGRMPAAMRRTFEDYESLVNGQVFSRLDEVEGLIATLALSAILDDGLTFPVTELQIYPEGRAISFEVARVAAARDL